MIAALQKLYPQILSKLCFELAPKPTKAEKAALGKKEEGCELEASNMGTQEDLLLKQLASTEAVVWSPYEADEALQPLSELLMAAKRDGNA